MAADQAEGFAWPPSSDATLDGEFVSLSPFVEADSEGLAAALTAVEFEHTAFAPLTAQEWPAYASRGAATGRFPWTVRLVQPVAGVEPGTIIGTTSYYDVSPRDAHLSVGYTAYTQRVWGTAVNAECKLLLLSFAFDTLGIARAQLKTDSRNLRSQAAMRALGATQEAVLRKHMRRTDGSLRDTVVFSILDTEWPQASEKIRARLAARR